MFGACGTVEDATVVTDRETGRSKGFGFVEMATDEEAKAAVQKMNGSTVGERQIRVDEARPPERRGGGGGGDRGGYGGGRGRY
jgi:RNA recognition motif-containing protein